MKGRAYGNEYLALPHFSVLLPLGVTAGQHMLKQRAETQEQGIPHVKKHRKQFKTEALCYHFPHPKEHKLVFALFL